MEEINSSSVNEINQRVEYAMQTRSRIPQIQQRAKELIAELKKNKDVLDLILDEFVPLLEGGEVESAPTEEKEVRTRAKRCGKEGCEKLSTDPVHNPKSIGTSEFHEFVPRKRKRGIPANAVQSITQDIENVGPQIEDEACARCPNPIDHNIHHKTTMDGYHEFKSAA